MRLARMHGTRTRVFVIGVVGSAAIAVALGLLLGGEHPPRLWISAKGSDANPCSRAQPCASFARAFRMARPGQVVEVAGGAYPEQTITFASGRRGSEHVVFRPRDDERVVVGGLRLGSGADARDGPEGLSIERMAIGTADGKQRTVSALEGTRSVVLRDLDAANFYLDGVKDFAIRGGDWGPCTTTSTDTQSNEAVDGCSNSKIDGNAANDDITIEDAVFHDYRIVPGSGAHFECMIVFGGTDITIRRNKFYNCEFYDIFIQDLSGLAFDGLTIENNWFDAPWNGSGAQDRPVALALSPRGRAFHDVLIRFNSFLDSGMSLNDDQDGTRYSSFRVVGNIARSYWAGCYPSVEFRFNLWIGSVCDGTDRSVASFPYAGAVKGPAADYRLTEGPAVDLVPGGASDTMLDRDIDSNRRPSGRARDAGAHELDIG
jgi:hypothetical protein